VKKKRPPYNPNAAIRSAIRRAFSRSPIVREVMDAARRDVPRYNKDGSRGKVDAVERLCNVCKVWTATKNVAVDHMQPVISVSEGFKDWNTFVDRLGFEKKENLQVICDTCHQSKTNLERALRQSLVDTKLMDSIQDQLTIVYKNPVGCISDVMRNELRTLNKELTKIAAKKKRNPHMQPISDRAITLKFNITSIIARYKSS